MLGHGACSGGLWPVRVVYGTASVGRGHDISRPPNGIEHEKYPEKRRFSVI